MSLRLLTIGVLVLVSSVAAAIKGATPAQPAPGTAPAAPVPADGWPPAGLAVYQAYTRLDPPWRLRRTAKVEPCTPAAVPVTRPATGPATPATLPAPPARIRLDVPLRSFSVPADVREVWINAPWTRGPFTLTAEGGGRWVGWRFPADASGGVSKWGDWGDVPPADSLPLAVTYAPEDGPLNLPIPRAAEHVRVTVDSGEVPQYLYVALVEDTFSWGFWLRTGFSSAGTHDPRKYEVTREVRKVGVAFAVLKGLRAAGLSEAEAKAAAAGACEELAALTDEALWLEVLAVDKERLIAADRVPDAARLGVLFALDAGSVWADGLVCRTKVGAETVYVAQSDLRTPEFQIQAFGPDGKYAWHGSVRTSDRFARTFDREALLRELHALLDPG